MSNYIPTRIFKFIEPTTVERIFRKCGVPMPDVRLDASARCREALQDAWKETKASARGALAVARLDEVFQDISDIATSRQGPTSAASSARSRSAATRATSSPRARRG